MSPKSTLSVFIHEPPVFGLLAKDPESKKILMNSKGIMKKSAALIKNGDIEEGARLFVEQVAFGEGSWENLFDKAARSTIISNADTWLDQSDDPERLLVDMSPLQNYQNRVTISTGTNTLQIFQEVVKKIEGILSKSYIVKIKGGGHGAHISHPEIVSNAISYHLNEVSKDKRKLAY